MSQNNDPASRAFAAALLLAFLVFIGMALAKLYQVWFR